MLTVISLALLHCALALCHNNVLAHGDWKGTGGFWCRLKALVIGIGFHGRHHLGAQESSGISFSNYFRF